MTPLDRPSTPAPSLSPVSAQERLVTLDVLRGIALLGVVIANVWLWFSGLNFRFPEYRQELLQLSLDTVVFAAIAVFVSGKAMSTFSFLFGLGFAVQMLRAEARGRSIVPTYLRRLTVLLAIGVAHMVLLWYGDILTLYAVFGFALLLFRRRTDRTLLAWATVFIVGVPLLLGALPLALSALGVALPQPDLATIAARNKQTLAVFQTGGYGEIMRENLHQAGQMYLGRKAPFLLYIAGLFILGLYVGRRRIFENVETYRRSFRRIAGWGLPIGLVSGLAMALLQMRADPTVIMSRPVLMFGVMTLYLAHTVLMAAGYISAATLLLQRRAFARGLMPFAFVGRMALTNYLTQTVVMLLVFYPLGGAWIGRTGPTVNLVIALAVFGVQMIVSRVWLTYFQFGPMEWVWRSLTYGARQPMRVGHVLVPRPRRSATLPT